MLKKVFPKGRKKTWETFFREVFLLEKENLIKFA